ncbi:glycosyltransferase family 8 protein [Lacticaseibacillus parakribbianus]|uniref:glycosyltransferase family 8 protein n=1 Tax=Lacticaseibacillus parakribbianus TaxID=2970927 RepID=UPI0021CB2A05
MNILFCGDARAETGIALASLALARQVNTPLHIYLLTASIQGFTPLSPAVAPRLEAMLRRFNAEHRVTLLDVTEPFNEAPPTANLATRFTPYCMLRLYADLLPLPDRLLYLDFDVVCMKDPAAFYQQDLTELEVVGTLDHYGKWFFRRGWHLHYLNSGVLLLNLAEIRRTGLFARCRQALATKRYFMPDQSALNNLAQHVRLAPRRANDQHGPHADTVFMHYSTRLHFWPWFHPVTVKPWDVAAMHETLHDHSQDALLADFAALTNYTKEGL